MSNLIYPLFVCQPLSNLTCTKSPQLPYNQSFLSQNHVHLLNILAHIRYFHYLCKQMKDRSIQVKFSTAQRLKILYASESFGGFQRGIRDVSLSSIFLLFYQHKLQLRPLGRSGIG